MVSDVFKNTARPYASLTPLEVLGVASVQQAIVLMSVT